MKPIQPSSPTQAQAVSEVLALLASLKPARMPGFRGKFGRQAEVAGDVLLSISGALLAALLSVMAARYFGRLPASWAQPVWFVAIATYLLGILAVLCHTVSGSTSLWLQEKLAVAWRQSEWMHDHANAARLQVFDRSDLVCAQFWLEQRIKRAEQRQVRVFGGSDKLALFALLPAGWAVWKDMSTMHLPWSPSPWILVGAFFIGLALGGMRLAKLLSDLGYQRDLLGLALQTRLTAPNLFAANEPAAAVHRLSASV